MIPRTSCVYCGDRTAPRTPVCTHDPARDRRIRHARLYACSEHVPLVESDPSYPYVDKSVDDTGPLEVYARPVAVAQAGRERGL